MANYKNQTTIRIGAIERPLQHIKDEKKNGETVLFLKAMNWDPLLDVMCDLSTQEFLLWQYLNKWKGKEQYDFSPADLENNFGWSDTSARKYRDGLVEKGYLKKVGKSTYDFIPYLEITPYRAAKRREENKKKREERENKKKSSRDEAI